MMRCRSSALFISSICMISGVAAQARAEEPSLVREWRTNLGIVTFSREGDVLTATFARASIPVLKGKAASGTVTLDASDSKPPHSAKIEQGPSGNAFEGTIQAGNARQPFRGWRPDPEAAKGPDAAFSGLWLTSLGLMELEQEGKEVRGRYALRGTSSLSGAVAGRQLAHKYQWFRPGEGWFDLSEDGRTLSGAARGEGTDEWYAWSGRSAPEFARHAPLKAGAIVDGSTKGLLTYSARAPEDYRPGDGRKWPTLVLLHGSNMNAKSYVATFASAWPELAKGFLLLGINGESCSDYAGPEPRFNYTYINYVGRSTFQGFPGTDRESPALVAEAIKELKVTYPIGPCFVGGHSQGAFLTYSLLMNSPELFAGAFPISGGLIFQCEPSAYADEATRKAQRMIPLAIVHGKNDPVVSFNLSRHAADAFGDSGWPALRLFTSDSAGHMFARLPVDDAVRWLAALASDDPATLLGFADDQIAKDNPRDAIAAARKLRALRLSEPDRKRLDGLAADLDGRAKPGAEEYLAKIRANADGSWIDGFLDWRGRYEFADAAAPTMGAFEALRAKQEPAAKEAYGEANRSFRAGKRDEGYAKYEEIAAKSYASSLYRAARRALDERR